MVVGKSGYTRIVASQSTPRAYTRIGQRVVAVRRSDCFRFQLAGAGEGVCVWPREDRRARRTDTAVNGPHQSRSECTRGNYFFNLSRLPFPCSLGGSPTNRPDDRQHAPFAFVQTGGPRPHGQLATRKRVGPTFLRCVPAAGPAMVGFHVGRCSVVRATGARRHRGGTRNDTALVRKSRKPRLCHRSVGFSVGNWPNPTLAPSRIMSEETNNTAILDASEKNLFTSSIT
ncbi:hypothetical protein B296_00030593 [Ensete ventricosum]|uniref:Uncharacterized protein n=1 Tax=Ensete ventricosum TaxID=4639 RepID=A0A426Y0C2_ENSVE|nr:hypothetical protein B296_00030593 [Ensete ventricosum]